MICSDDICLFIYADSHSTEAVNQKISNTTVGNTNMDTKTSSRKVSDNCADFKPMLYKTEPINASNFMSEFSAKIYKSFGDIQDIAKVKMLVYLLWCSFVSV